MIPHLAGLGALAWMLWFTGPIAARETSRRVIRRPEEPAIPPSLVRAASAAGVGLVRIARLPYSGRKYMLLLSEKMGTATIFIDVFCEVRVLGDTH
ncbi:MAG: hypothetical protein GXP58_07290 [Deltaproteobacteria bacterium]|nr:hypothetical protein [Deltaproteobacteria bacterium]